MFRPENRRDTIGMFVGFGMLALGVVLLLLAFSIASGIASRPGEYLQSQIPQTAEEPKGPRAAFRWTSSGPQVTFVDASEQGDAPLTSWQWDFGDGSSSSASSPSHTYTRNGNYVVRLTVRDGNQKATSAISSVTIVPAGEAGGNSATDVADIAGSLDLSSVFGPIMNVAVGVGAVVATALMLMVMVLVGSVITKAGWNLARPRPETIKVRIKPRHLEVEPPPPPAPPPG